MVCASLPLEIQLAQLVAALGPEAKVSGPLHRSIRTVVCDSRRVRRGDLFVAVRGAHVDGSRYIGEALKRGAAAIVLWEGEGSGAPGDATWVRVPDERAAMARLACALHGHPSRALRVVGITGTNGKTTTTWLLHHLLERAGSPCGLIGSVAYRFQGRRIPAQRTTPESCDLQALLAQMVRAGCASAVMEVSSHGLAQQRVSGTEFDVVGFTNLTPEHLDYHGTLEAYFEAKKRLFVEEANAQTVGVVNRDDAWGRRLLGECAPERTCWTYGLEGGADVTATDVHLGTVGLRFQLHSPWHNGPVVAPLMGRFNLSNVLGALTTCGALGMNVAQACEQLAEVEPVPGRMQRVPGPRDVHVFVDYAHTEDALRNALDALREVAARRLIVVFGCGGDRDATKRPRMGAVAAARCDRVVLTTDNPRSEPPERIIAEIRAGCGNDADVVEVPDRREAIALALREARPGDVILVAGKGHEAYQEVGHTVLAFDDCDVIREETNRLASGQAEGRHDRS